MHSGSVSGLESVDGGSMPLLGHHELVALGVDAHGEVQWILGSVVGLGGEAAAALGEAGDAGAEVVELEGKAGPGALALAAAMNADGGAGDDDLTPGFIGEGDLAAEHVLIEIEAAAPVGGPQGVFDFEDFHGEEDGFGFCLT